MQKKEFHPERYVSPRGRVTIRVGTSRMPTLSLRVCSDSMNAYVVFRTEDSARWALAANGALLGGKHIRVDLSDNKARGHTTWLLCMAEHTAVACFPYGTASFVP